jgi:16S rRNA (cytosine967-C5)-methyltransferase
MSGEAYLEKLAAAGKTGSVHPTVAQAVLLADPCEVTELPGFEEGLVSVQDLSAQCAIYPLALAPNLKVLDACAAPGGKTALMAEREPTLSITAIDSDASRLQRLEATLKRCRVEAKVLLADAALPGLVLDEAPFDRILLDAPCSALGVIRRHPDIKVRKGAGDLKRLPPLQGALLKAAWSMLRSGGRLVYATCTITRTENHDVIARFLDGAADAELVPPEQWAGWPDLGESDGVGRQIFPGESGADGFFYAAIDKT